MQVPAQKLIYFLAGITVAISVIWPQSEAYAWVATHMRRQSQLEVTLVGTNTTSVSGTTVAYTFGTTIPAGSMIVAVFGGRCAGATGTWSASDTKANSYSNTAGANSPTTVVVATVVFYSVLTTPLVSGDTLTLSCGTTTGALAKSMAVFQFNRPALLDGTGTNPQAANIADTVSTTSAIAVGREFVVGASSNPGASSTYTDDPAFTTAFVDNSNVGSNVIISYRLSNGLSGIQTYAPVRSANGSQCVNSIATFR